jgi:hypothetical protein
MADRTREAEDEGTGRPAPPASHVYQEGSVESIGERPTDTDRDDRTGQGPVNAPGDAGRRRDEFISSEVSDRTARPMRNSKTQS